MLPIGPRIRNGKGSPAIRSLAIVPIQIPGAIFGPNRSSAAMATPEAGHSGLISTDGLLESHTPALERAHVTADIIRMGHRWHRMALGMLKWCCYVLGAASRNLFAAENHGNRPEIKGGFNIGRLL